MTQEKTKRTLAELRADVTQLAGELEDAQVAVEAATNVERDATAKRRSAEEHRNRLREQLKASTAELITVTERLP